MKSMICLKNARSGVLCAGSRNWLMTIALALGALLPIAALGADEKSAGRIASIDWPTVERLLAARDFSSREELFQLLHILYNKEKMTAFRLEKDVLKRLDGEIATLFPLAGCIAIEVDRDRVVFQFDGEQDITVPNTWLQASLHLPGRLVLKISPLPAEPDPATGEPDPTEHGLAFTVEEGTVQVRFSFLLKLFGGKLRDAEGRRLVYRISETRRISRLQLVEVTPLGVGQIRAAAASDSAAGTLWFDILHPDFPGERDIGITGRSIEFLGTSVELLPEKMIRIGTAEPQKNDTAWQWFDTTIGVFRTFAEPGDKALNIEYTRNFGYHFEERQIVMNMGFQAAGTVP